MDARSLVEGLSKDDFLGDKRTQQAVIMSFIIIGEASTKVMDACTDFAQNPAEMPWHNMRGMRTHGYLNLDVV